MIEVVSKSDPTKVDNIILPKRMKYFQKCSVAQWRRTYDSILKIIPSFRPITGIFLHGCLVPKAQI